MTVLIVTMTVLLEFIVPAIQKGNLIFRCFQILKAPQLPA